VLDDVERRAFLVKPAGKNALPVLVHLLHVHLDESAGIVVGFPWRGLFARAQVDDDVADAHRLPRLQRDIAADAVTLVEQAKHRHALRHRCSATRRILIG